jgi:S1-C subfamily serine protease
MSSLVRPLVMVSGLLAAILLSTTLAAAENPRPVIKPVPEQIADLRDLEKQVHAVVAKVMPATVGLRMGPSQGSGVLIKDGYVLTAGHVSGQPTSSASIKPATRSP